MMVEKRPPNQTCRAELQSAKSRGKILLLFLETPLEHPVMDHYNFVDISGFCLKSKGQQKCDQAKGQAES